MTDEPMTDETEEEIHQRVVTHFREGVRALARAVDELDDDPAKALAHMTFYALRFADNAQSTTETLAVEGELADRYLSMQGMLCGPRGELVDLTADEFPALLGRLDAAVDR
ncbi:hypothetical protein ACFV0D_12600 [Streptomyces sp. NPDC059556]|uniref:hypothetical protein n=1 Tax=Streptomyces sp. NPDC059556 TaxID=3346863 RepID=UPI00368E3828